MDIDRPKPSVTTGQALARPTCLCGAGLSSCHGCGEGRCLICDPYLSDDCRWGV